jgi:hypothetical protein
VASLKRSWVGMVDGIPDPEYLDGKCQHYSVVIGSRRVRDGFRKRYWIKCWNCDLDHGPFADQLNATDRQAALDHMQQQLRLAAAERSTRNDRFQTAAPEIQAGIQPEQPGNSREQPHEA